MFYCLNCLMHVLSKNISTAASVGMLSYLLGLAFYYWDADMFMWVALLGGLYASSCDCKYKIDAANLIALWWCGNMTLIVLLNAYFPRPFQEEGATVYLFGYETLVLTLDYLILAPFDFLAIAFIWSITKQNIQRLTIWHLVICTYLVSNLYAHFSSCYFVFVGISPDTVVAQYDGFMYGSFYACLIALLAGSLTDRFVKYGGYGIDLDLDVRAFVSGYISFKRWS